MTALAGEAMASIRWGARVVALAGAGALAGHWGAARWQRERREPGPGPRAPERTLSAPLVRQVQPGARTPALALAATTGAPVKLSTLQEAQAFGGDPVSVAVMEARHEVRNRVLARARRCMATSRSSGSAVLRFAIELRALERDVDFLVRLPDILRGDLDDADLQCLVREVTGAHRLRNRLSVGGTTLSGDEQYSVTFRSGSRSNECVSGQIKPEPVIPSR
jgi:hypothetical protein